MDSLYLVNPWLLLTIPGGLLLFALIEWVDWHQVGKRISRIFSKWQKWLGPINPWWPFLLPLVPPLYLFLWLVARQKASGCIDQMFYKEVSPMLPEHSNLMNQLVLQRLDHIIELLGVIAQQSVPQPPASPQPSHDGHFCRLCGGEATLITWKDPKTGKPREAYKCEPCQKWLANNKAGGH